MNLKQICCGSPTITATGLYVVNRALLSNLLLRAYHISIHVPLQVVNTIPQSPSNSKDWITKPTLNPTPTITLRPDPAPQNLLSKQKSALHL